MAHHHFTRDDRVLLAKLKTAGFSNRSCARILGFHPSTIGRELRRGYGATATGYSVRVARRRTALLRLRANQQHRKLHIIQAERITALLRCYYSPMAQEANAKTLGKYRKRPRRVFGKVVA